MHVLTYKIFCRIFCSSLNNYTENIPFFNIFSCAAISFFATRRLWADIRRYTRSANHADCRRAHIQWMTLL